MDCCDRSNTNICVSNETSRLLLCRQRFDLHAHQLRGYVVTRTQDNYKYAHSSFGALSWRIG